MVNRKSVQESNAALRTAITGQIALFVGATSGIAYHTLMEYAKHSDQPRIYITGRNDVKLLEIVGKLDTINPRGRYIPIKSEISLLKNVDAACEHIEKREEHLDLLVMCPGYLKLSRQDNTDGLEDSISLRYYVRMRFVQKLLPLHSASATSRIVSIHGGGKEGHLIEYDLELKDNFSLRTAAMHTSTMNTLALAEIASSYPSISCIHVFPGVVITPSYRTFAEDWYLPFRIFFTHVALPIIKVFSVGLQESGERHLFHATSARYPPAANKDPPATGLAMPEGVEVAKGWDRRAGSGFYVLNWNGETVGDESLFEEYRKRGMGRKIWEHTQEVFDRVLGRHESMS